MSGDWLGKLWTLLVTFCIVIIRCTETFWPPCIIESIHADEIQWNTRIFGLATAFRETRLLAQEYFTEITTFCVIIAENLHRFCVCVCVGGHRIHIPNSCSYWEWPRGINIPKELCFHTDLVSPRGIMDWIVFESQIRAIFFSTPSSSLKL
jgi:hypothetical protein